MAFAHFGFNDDLLTLIRRSEFYQLTPIQSQAIPAALSGRDIIGIAKTGSEKTAGFLWPLLVHAIDQPELKEEDGPIGMICVPTREPTIFINSDDARHFAMPLAKTDQRFQNFLMSYTDIGLKYRENKIHLMVVTYTKKEGEYIN